MNSQTLERTAICAIMCHVLSIFVECSVFPSRFTEMCPNPPAFKFRRYLLAVSSHGPGFYQEANLHRLALGFETVVNDMCIAMLSSWVSRLYAMFVCPTQGNSGGDTGDGH